MCCGCHNDSEIVLLTSPQRMSHSVGGLGPGLSLWKPPPHTDNSCTGSPASMMAPEGGGGFMTQTGGFYLRSVQGIVWGLNGESGLCEVNICATSLMMQLGYTTPTLTSLLPSLLLLIGRGAQTDSGEPLLWQLPPKRRTKGQPDIFQRPPQSDRAGQKPIRWDAAATAAFRCREQESLPFDRRPGRDERSLPEAHASGFQHLPRG